MPPPHPRGQSCALNSEETEFHPTLLAPGFSPFFFFLVRETHTPIEIPEKPRFPQKLGMGEGGSIAQRQGGFRGLPGKLGSKHGLKVPLGGGQGFETRQAEGTCPRPRGAPEAGRLPPAEASAMPGGGGSRTTGARLRRLRVPSPPGRRPGTGSSRTDGRTDRPSLPSTPSPTGRGANTHSAGRRGAEGAAAQTHPGGCGASSVTVALPGTGGSTTPSPRAASSGAL